MVSFHSDLLLQEIGPGAPSPKAPPKPISPPSTPSTSQSISQKSTPITSSYSASKRPEGATGKQTEGISKVHTGPASGGISKDGREGPPTTSTAGGAPSVSNLNLKAKSSRPPRSSSTNQGKVATANGSASVASVSPVTTKAPPTPPKQPQPASINTTTNSQPKASPTKTKSPLTPTKRVTFFDEATQSKTSPSQTKSPVSPTQARSTVSQQRSPAGSKVGNVKNAQSGSDVSGSGGGTERNVRAGSGGSAERNEEKQVGIGGARPARQQPDQQQQQQRGAVKRTPSTSKQRTLNTGALRQQKPEQQNQRQQKVAESAKGLASAPVESKAQAPKVNGVVQPHAHNADQEEQRGVSSGPKVAPGEARSVPQQQTRGQPAN
ncbi:hypothetical protein HK102_011270, partial [Quaeritorhiza haematococci]